MVVEQDTGVTGDETRAKRAVHGQRCRHPVAIGIDNGKMRRFLSFLRRIEDRRQVSARRGPCQVNAFCAAARICH